MEKIRKPRVLSRKISGKMLRVTQFVFFLTLGLTLQVSAHTSAQVVHLKEQEHTLKALFEEVEKPSRFTNLFQ